MKGISNNPVLEAYHRLAVSPVSGNRAVQARTPTESSVENAAHAEVKISELARELSANGSPVNVEKVEALRSRIEQGSFQVDSERLAKRLLDVLG
jgi:flagellar biosynthesis anti-sigma factor FlgM